MRPYTTLGDPVFVTDDLDEDEVTPYLREQGLLDEYNAPGIELVESVADARVRLLGDELTDVHTIRRPDGSIIDNEETAQDRLDEAEWVAYPTELREVRR